MNQPNESWVFTQNGVGKFHLEAYGKVGSNRRSPLTVVGLSPPNEGVGWYFRQLKIEDSW